MFDGFLYLERRKKLIKSLNGGVALFLGNDESCRNYPANTYRFRQDSSFLYYFGIDRPSLAGVVDADSGSSFVFGDEDDFDYRIWNNKRESLKDTVENGSLCIYKQKSELSDFLKNAVNKRRKIMFLPQYRFENMLLIEELLGIKALSVNNYASVDLIKAVASQRLKKDKYELDEIKKAVEISRGMYDIAFDRIREGIKELDVLSECEAYAIKNGVWLSFPTILTKRGDILHNTSHNEILKKGDLVIMDSGVETNEHYASDITRTIPVGSLESVQRDIYRIVDNAQKRSVSAIKDGVKFLDVHMQSAFSIADDLKGLGLFKGNANSIVESGAYAIVYPHGVGHPLGLDVHDLEALGENYVGYDDNIKRSDKFGLSALRFAKELKSGYVMTAEPGVYFIEELILSWESDNKFKDFINYNELKKFIGLGGVRIEDDIVVEKNGCKILSLNIKKA